MSEAKPHDLLQAERLTVSRWINETNRTLEYGYHTELRKLSGRQVFLEPDPAVARRYVVVATEMAHALDRQAAEIRARAASDIERMNPHLVPGWGEVWAPRQLAQAIVGALMRRALPLQKDDLVALLDWCVDVDNLGPYLAPIGSIVKALTRFASEPAIEPDLAQAVARFGKNFVPLTTRKQSGWAPSWSNCVRPNRAPLARLTNVQRS